MMTITATYTKQTNKINEQRNAARIARASKKRMQDILKELAKEATQTTEQDRRPIGNDQVTAELASGLGTKSPITAAQFALLVSKARKETHQFRNHAGFISNEAIQASCYAKLVKQIVSVYVMTFGIGYATKLLRLAANDQLNTDVTERASGIAVLLLCPEPTQKGQRQSVIQLCIDKNQSIQQVTASIKLLVKREIDRYLDQYTRGTTQDMYKTTELIEEKTVENPETGASTDGNSSHLFSKAEVATGQDLWQEHVTEVFSRAINDLNAEQTAVLNIYLSDTARDMLDCSKAAFTGQLLAIRELTGLSVRKTRQVANEIVESIRTTLGISGIDEAYVMTGGWNIKSTQSRRRRGLNSSQSRNAQWIITPVRDDKMVNQCVMPAQEWTHDDYQSGFKVGKQVFTAKHVETLFSIAREGTLATHI